MSSLVPDGTIYFNHTEQNFGADSHKDSVYSSILQSHNYKYGDNIFPRFKDPPSHDTGCAKTRLSRPKLAPYGVDASCIAIAGYCFENIKHPPFPSSRLCVILEFGIRILGAMNRLRIRTEEPGKAYPQTF